MGGCMVRERLRTTRQKRQRDEEVGTGKRGYMGSYLHESRSFLAEGYYSLDRCPLMAILFT